MPLSSEINKKDTVPLYANEGGSPLAYSIVKDVEAWYAREDGSPLGIKMNKREE